MNFLAIMSEDKWALLLIPPSSQWVIYKWGLARQSWSILANTNYSGYT